MKNWNWKSSKFHHLLWRPKGRLEFGVSRFRQIGQRKHFRSQRDTFGHFESCTISDLIPARILVKGDGATLTTKGRLIGQRFRIDVARLRIRMTNGNELMRLFQFALLLFLVLIHYKNLTWKITGILKENFYSLPICIENWRCGASHGSVSSNT